MKTKLSVSVLFFVGFVISITVIQSAVAEDPRVKMGLAALWTFDKDTVQGKKSCGCFREQRRNHHR